MNKSRSMQTPLAAVRGLGSAKSGLHHWWNQRMTAVAMVILEDYVAAEGLRLVLIVVIRMFAIALAALSILSILRVAL